jgi:hypothetical protein
MTMYITPNGMVKGGVAPFDKDKFEKQFKNSIISQEKGKYKFIKEYTPLSICSEFNNIGLCVKRKESPTYKIGDIIDVETFWFGGSDGKEILAKLPIKEQNLGVPISFLQKVSDSTSIVSSSSTPKDNSNLVKIALLLVGGYLVYKLVKK